MAKTAVLCSSPGCTSPRRSFRRPGRQGAPCTGRFGRRRGRARRSRAGVSANMYERGVDGQGIARVRSKGDRALFGGHSTASMKKRLGIKRSTSVANHLPAVTIAAKQLATELTSHNIEERDLFGEGPITSEHVQSNQGVRDLLGRREKGHKCRKRLLGASRGLLRTHGG